MALLHGDRGLGGVVEQQRLAFHVGEQVDVGALRGLGDLEDLVDPLRDGRHVTDEGDKPACLGALLELVERLVERVWIEAAEALVEEQSLQATTAAAGELD